MKTNIVGIIIALILTFVGMLSVYAQDTKVSEVRKVDAFSSIEITSVGTIYFTQSDTYSFKIEGKEKHVKNTETTVKDGCLLIGFKDRKNKSMRNQKDGVTIWISAPDLKKVEFTGVGEFNCEKPLKLDEVSFEVKGVVGASSKPIMFSNVDFPQPEGPMILRNSPLFTSRFTFSNATVSISFVR